MLKLVARCRRVRRNNGIVEALFTAPETSTTQEYHVLVNVRWEKDQFVEGKIYPIEIGETLDEK